MTRTTLIFAVSLLILNTCEAKKNDLQKAAAQLLEKEAIKYNLNSCKVTTLASVQRLRLSNKIDEAIGCLFKSLTAVHSNDVNWSYLGDLYMKKGERSKGMTCFKQAAKISGRVSDYVRQWHFVGPFVIGKSEVDGDPVEFWGGIANISRDRFDKKVTFYSELAAGGKVHWKAYPQTQAGESLRIAPDVPWNDLISSLGSMAISEWQGWVVGEFAVNSEGDVSFQCLGVHTLFVDGIMVAADVYRRNEFWFTLSMGVGIHTIYIRLRAKGVQVFQCNIKSFETTSFRVHPPTMVPDIVQGSLMGGVFALPITNLQGGKWLKNIRINLEDKSAPAVTVWQSKDSTPASIAPGQTAILAVNLQLNREDDDNHVNNEGCEDIRFQLEVSASSVSKSRSVPVTLRCRNRHESFLFSFVDHDGSVQQAAAIEPLEDCSASQCPVVLTLHGTGVPAQNQADGYKRMDKDGQWKFGLEKAWVLAPTRHGAHNWEGPGTLTSMTALDRLEQLMAQVPWMVNKPVANQVIFAGHSMGGHGAWHLATHYPDRALAVVSLAGWIKKEEYGDSNVFFRHDVSTSHTDPALKQILEACIAENEADRHASNLQSLPVLTRIGANDRTVHPFFVRRMNRLLKERGINVTYSELAGKEHWWWDTWETNDGGAVNDPKLRDFANSHANIQLASPSPQSCHAETGECSTSTSSPSKYASPGNRPRGYRSFTLTVVNPALGEGLRGVSVIQQVVPFRTSTIQMDLTEESAELRTKNVARFLLRDLQYVPYQWKQVNKILVDGIEFSEDDIGIFFTEEENAVQFCLTEQGVWKVCHDNIMMDDRQRSPVNYGPARRIAESKFIIVTGTKNKETKATILHLAVYLANLFFLTSDAVAMVMEDSALQDDVAALHNLIIVGGPAENLWAEQFLDKVPISTNEDGLLLGRCRFSDPLTGALFLAPHQSGRLVLALMGNSLQGLVDIMRLASPTIPPMTRSPFSNMVPDYVITGPEFRAKGPGGYECAGFWGNSWDYRLELSSCVC
ncbi:uncharacterized protein [Diadema setosum]|uniref:uncharacterized protein isoform X1 n=1 Tax=Diadema setosum TaxID=31175 RepID=UPI003B3A014F